MKVVFVPLHIDRAPELEDSEERASRREWEFLRSSLDGDDGGLS